MTYNQLIKFLEETALANPFVKFFGTGELWEIEGNLKPAPDSLMIWLNPVNSVVNDNQLDRQFNMLCMGRVKKDKSNEQEVLSDSEQVLWDMIKVIKDNEDTDVNGSPTMTPFKEDFGDWLTGWNAEIIITTDFDNNPCNIPE